MGGPPYEDAMFIKSLTQSFLNFVTDLDPNIDYDILGSNPPAWPVYTFGEEMIFNKTADGVSDIHIIETNEALLDRCRYWRSVGVSTSQ